MVMVHIRDDRETTIAFQEWCLSTRPQILSAGRHGSASGDSCCGYYSVEDESRIREWFAERAAPTRVPIDESKGEWRCRCPSSPTFDTSANPRFVKRCDRCGAERPAREGGDT
jgi:hypothetical protein